MTQDIDEDDDWPDYLPGPSSHLEALGVISLTYGYLEGLFQILFESATGMKPEQVTELFQRIPNNTRTAIMTNLVRKTKLPANLKERVEHFVSGFTVCMENRHSLMHSQSGGIIVGLLNPHKGFVFTKRGKAGNRMVCTPSIGELRRVADSMNEYGLFAVILSSALNSARQCAMQENSTWLPPLLEKPALPISLNWHPEAEFNASVRIETLTAFKS